MAVVLPGTVVPGIIVAGGTGRIEKGSFVVPFERIDQGEPGRIVPS